MTRKLAFIIAALQVLVLTYMAGEREFIMKTGRLVYLRTAPVDPRDVMRGDYVRLAYEISRVPRAMSHGGLTNLELSGRTYRDLKVYAHLRESGDGVAELTALSDSPPAQGLYVRGRLEPSWGGQLTVRYGLEAYFMEQGKALELERRMPDDGIQVPLEMQVAVSRGGKAVLKGHRWPALGIGLELETESQPRTNQATRRTVLGARIKLKNTSTNDVAIVDLPGGRSLVMVDASFDEPKWTWTPPADPPVSPRSENVILVKPGAIHTVRVSFRDERWLITKRDRPEGEREKKSLSDLSEATSTRFRFEYRPPASEACTGLPHEHLIWHGRLPTRAFSPAGWTD